MGSGAAPCSSTGQSPSERARASESLVLARLRQRMLGRETERTRVGRYILGECLGVGGMAVVVRAFDPQLDRDVAIKLVRGPRDGQRLAREAKALARLAHPNVVSIFDVGLAGPDEVFIAMELVEGETLSKRLSSGKVHWTESLPWLIAAARGLAAAHRVGLVHRDFKPDNVIVGDDGRVRVADFGLSRTPTTGPATPSTTPADSGNDLITLTRSRGIVGTPLYMAPEQHVGGSIDARTDVYGFCVVLFEAVFGTRPFTGSSWDGLIAAKRVGVREPSARHDVPTWLWRVIERGLQSDPAKRWPTMDAVLAALGDRASRRTRPITSLLATVAVAVTAVCAAPAWATDATTSLESAPALAGLASRAQVIAGVAAHRDGDYAGAAARYEQAFHGAVEGRADGGARDAAARLALVSIHGLRQTAAAQRWIRHARVDDAGAPSNMLTTRAEGHVALAQGDHDVAARHFDALLASAEQDGDPIAIAIALCDVGDAQHRVGRFEDAAASRRRAITIVLRAGHGDDPVRTRALAGLGRTLRELARPAEARAAHAQVLELRQRTLRADHPDIASALNDIGAAEIDAGEFERGQEHLARALAIYESSLGPDHPQIGMVHAAMGNGFCDARRFDEARMHHERAVAVFTTAWGPDHPHVGGELLNVGRVVYEQGHDVAALRAFTQGLDVLERALGPDHPHVASASHNVGQTAARLHRPAEALVHLERAVSIRMRTLGPEHPLVAQTRAAQAAALRDLGFAEAAAEEFDAAVAALDGVVGFEDTLAHARYGLALALVDTGRDSERAIATAKAAIAFHRSRGGDDDVNVTEIAAWLSATTRG